MERWVAEKQFGALRTLEVQVSIVFPREPDTTVNLDVLRRRVEVRL